MYQNFSCMFVDFESLKVAVCKERNEVTKLLKNWVLFYWTLKRISRGNWLWWLNSDGILGSFINDFQWLGWRRSNFMRELMVRGRSQITSRKKTTFSTPFPLVTNFPKKEKNFVRTVKILLPSCPLKRQVICERPLTE